MNIVCYTLSFNLPSEVEKATRRMRMQNPGTPINHYIIDLGFPISEGDVIPDDIEQTKIDNTIELRRICNQYGSKYLKMMNIGVSQNHSEFFNFIKPKDDDVLIALDPDECPLSYGWVSAMADVFENFPHLGMLSLLQEGIEEHVKPEHYNTSWTYKKNRAWTMKALVNWAFIGFSGEFINKINRTIPFPEKAPIYGYIEGALLPKFKETNMDWAILPDYKVRHTDDVPLYREYKDQIIHRIAQYGQITFEEFLRMKKEGKL